jgi:hypothetical protein
MSRFSSRFHSSSIRHHNPPRRGSKPRVAPFEDINYEYTGSIGQIHAYIMSASEADRRISQAQAALGDTEPNIDGSLGSSRYSLIQSLNGRPELLSSAVQVFERLAAASSLLGHIPFKLLGSSIGGSAGAAEGPRGRSTSARSRRSGTSAAREGISAASVSALAAAGGRDELTLTFGFRLNDIHEQSQNRQAFINDIVNLALFDLSVYFPDADNDDEDGLVWNLTFDVKVTPQGFTVKTHPLAPLIFEYLRNYEMREIPYNSNETQSFFYDPRLFTALDSSPSPPHKGQLVRVVKSSIEGENMIFAGDFANCMYLANKDYHSSLSNGVLTAAGGFRFEAIEELKAYALFFDALAEELSVYDAFTKELASAIDG